MRVGETGTLTTDVDVKTLGAGDDVFTAAVLTANDGDTLDGAGGSDTLNVETAASLTDKFVTSNIETVNLNALGAVTVNMKNMTGVETFNSNDAAGVVTVNNIADAAMAVSVKGSATNSLDLNYATGTLNGDADKLMATLNGSSATSIVTESGFESVEVKTTAKSDLATLTASGATALTLSGDAELTVTDTVIDSFTNYTITNTAKVTLGSVATIKSVDATANTAGIIAETTQATAGLDYGLSTDKLEMHSAGGIIQTGSGSDNINVDSDAVFSTNSTIVKLGAGDDKLNLSSVSGAGEYIYGEAGDDTIYVGAALTSADLIDGGEGTDTVSFKTGTHSLIAKGIEKVNVKGGTTVSFVSIDSTIDIADTTAGAGDVAFTNLLGGSTYTASGASARTGDLSSTAKLIS